jgi:hypothetical protein
MDMEGGILAFLNMIYKHLLVENGVSLMCTEGQPWI